MQHIMEELNIETEVIDPELLHAENQALKDDIATLESKCADLSGKLFDLRQQRRAARKEKHAHKGSGPRLDSKNGASVEIKDIDAPSTRSRKNQLTPSDNVRSRGGPPTVSTTSQRSKLPTRILGYLNNSERFAQAVGAESARDTPIIVDFTANQVAPCKRIRPTFDALSSEFTYMQFYLVDVDEGDQVAQAYDIEHMPTFVMFKNGSEIDRMQGASEQALREFIQKHA